jgi:uncharacterized membrane protein
LSDPNWRIAVAVVVERTRQSALHPLNAILLAAAIPLFAGALLSDIAYAKTYEIQWNNFASWLLAGGLFIGAFAVVCAIVGLVRADRREGRRIAYVVLLLATWVLGFVDALVHARDAWASMPTGLVLSTIVAVLACTAKWIALSGLGRTRYRLEDAA